MPEVDGPPAYSRRTALKRGAAAGGALVWTVPVISVISMDAAHAETPSGPRPQATAATPEAAGTGGTSGGLTATEAAIGGAGVLAAGAALSAAMRKDRRTTTDADDPA